MQQSVILRYHINFETITSSNDEDILYNLLNEWDKILKVRGGCVLKGLKDHIVK